MYLHVHRCTVSSILTPDIHEAHFLLHESVNAIHNWSMNWVRPNMVEKCNTNPFIIFNYVVFFQLCKSVHQGGEDCFFIPILTCIVKCILLKYQWLVFNAFLAYFVLFRITPDIGRPCSQRDRPRRSSELSNCCK